MLQQFRWWDDVDTSRGYTVEQGLRRIECHNNQLTEVPSLPKGLDKLRCHHNQIVSLPSIPIGTTHLNCSHNKLTELTDLPAKLEALYCNDNRQLALIDTYESEAFDRLGKNNATKTALTPEVEARMRLWGVRVD